MTYKHKHMGGVDKHWVICMVSNPVRYRSRYETFEKFKHGVERAGANLIIVELALGDRPFEVTEENNPHHVQLRVWDEIWHKENALNLAIQRLPNDWEYVTWLDADIEFQRHDWVHEIVHSLQHYMVIQPWATCVDMGHKGQAQRVQESFMYCWVNGLPPAYSRKDPYHPTKGPAHHPGYAWSARREAIDALGGLMDFPILGAADHHMAQALIGKVIEHAPKNVSAGYKRELLNWQERANIHIRQDVGYMDGTIFHHYHGRKADRKYTDRWQILFKHDYNPDQDLKRDWQGLWQLTHKGERMRNDIRAYFRQRDEDNPNDE